MGRWTWVFLAAALSSCGDRGFYQGDMVPYARLVASGTRVPEGAFWPREAEDSVATVRDDFPETTWKVPVGSAWMEIDLGPWLGRPVALDRLELALSGPATVSVDLGCGDGAQVPWPDPSAPLDLKGAEASCVRILIESQSPVEVASVRLFNAEPIEWPAVNMSHVQRASNAHQNYGVIEGFYGRPWSWRERQELLLAMAVHRMDLYLYAPKNDPFHRHRWREPYPPPDMERFERLARFAEALGIRFFYAVAPFIDGDFSGGGDLDALKAKLLSFAQIGVKGFALLADDIEFETEVNADATLAASQVDVVNRIVAAIRLVQPDAQFLFCPTLYSDKRVAEWPKGKEYLAGLAALDPAVQILWTGTDTASATLTGEDMKAFVSATGRKPLIWDNFWANDAGDMFMGRILAAPYLGRGADLPGAVAGIAQNPSIQGALSRLLLGTFGAWADDPLVSRESAIARALEVEDAFCFGIGRSKARDRETLRFLFEVADGHARQDPSYKALDEATAAFVAASKGNNVSQAWVLANVCGRMAGVLSEAHHSGLDPDLLDDLYFALDKVRLRGLDCLWLLAAAGERLAGRDGASGLGHADDLEAQAGANRFFFASAGPALRSAVEAIPQQDRGFVAPDLVAPDPPPCQAGNALSWTPFASGAVVHAYGLPGATGDGPGVKWTPVHPGRYEAVLVAKSPSGWAFHTANITCRP